MPELTERLSFEELCALADLPRRTVRFYIDQGLVDRPHGAKRGAWYTGEHLERLLAIRKWQQAGLNLARIRELVVRPEAGEALPPEAPKRPGDVSLRTHIHLGPGIELIVDPKEAELSPEGIHALARQVAAILEKVKLEKLQ